MTWYFDPSGTTMDVYDHTGSQVRQNYQFSGSWTGNSPDEVLTVMNEMIKTEYQTNGQTMYALEVQRHLSARDIKEGTP